MSNKNGPTLEIGKLPGDFKPDITLVIKYETSTNRMALETADGKMIDGLTVVQLCLGVAIANIQAIAAANQNLSKKSHPFIALTGETKCRAPRCGKPLDDEIHAGQEPQIMAVQ